MKNQVLILTYVLMFNCMNILAQDKSSFGFIITNNGDTIKGKIISYSPNLYKKCIFQDSKNNVMEFSPFEIKGFRFDNNGKFYISKKIPFEKELKDFFVEFLIQGKANIYYVRDHTEHFYIETLQDGIMEISKEDVVVRKNGVEFIQPYAYIGKLKYMLSDCPAIYDDIDKTKIYSNDLIKLARRYHQLVCDSEKCVIFERKSKPVQLIFSVVGGVSYNDFIFDKNNYTDYRFSNFYGIETEFHYLFFSAEQVYLKSGLIYQHFGTYHFNTNYILVNGYYKYGEFNYDKDIKAHTLRIPLTMHYVFTNSKLQPDFGFGINNMFFLTSNPELFIYEYNTYLGRAITPCQIEYMASLGIKYHFNTKNAICFEVSAGVFQNPNMNQMLRIQNHMLTAQIGYEF